MELVVTKRTTEDMELVAPKARKLLITAPGRKAGAEGYGAGGNDNNYGVYGAGGVVKESSAWQLQNFRGRCCMLKWQ